MKRATLITAALLLLASCGVDDDTGDASTKRLDMRWNAETPSMQLGLCVNADDIGFDAMARMWEEEWDDDGSTDDAAIADFLEEKCD